MISEEKKNIRRAITLVILSILFLIFLVSFGIPFFAKFAGFMSNLGKSDKPININDTTPPAPPRINNLPEYTNQKTLEISGVTEPGATVILNFNSESQELVSDREGKFSVKYNLVDSKNTFFALARDQSSNESQKTQVYTFIFDNKPPEITIENPKDQAEFFGAKQSRITVKGQAEAETIVTINDRLANTNDSGAFNLPLGLNEGENTITIKATDRAGNQTEKTLTVRYSP